MSFSVSFLWYNDFDLVVNINWTNIYNAPLKQAGRTYNVVIIYVLAKDIECILNVLLSAKQTSTKL